MTSRTPPRNSVAAMGFEAKFNQDYARFATATQTPYQRLVAAFDTDHLNNSQVGRLFDRVPSAARKWRLQVEQIETSGL